MGEKVKYSKYVPEQEVPEVREPPQCNDCPVVACWPHDPADVMKGPDFCDLKNYPDLIEKAKEMYLKEGIDREIQLQGARLEGISSSTPPWWFRNKYDPDQNRRGHNVLQDDGVEEGRLCSLHWYDWRSNGIEHHLQSQGI